MISWYDEYVYILKKASLTSNYSHKGGNDFQTPLILDLKEIIFRRTATPRPAGQINSQLLSNFLPCVSDSATRQPVKGKHAAYLVMRQVFVCPLPKNAIFDAESNSLEGLL